MCVISMVLDHYRGKFAKREWIPFEPTTPFYPLDKVKKSEIEEIKEELRELREWIKKAKKYDEENNQPDCETEEKAKLIKKLAELVGVDLKDLI